MILELNLNYHALHWGHIRCTIIKIEEFIQTQSQINLKFSWKIHNMLEIEEEKGISVYTSGPICLYSSQYI